MQISKRIHEPSSMSGHCQASGISVVVPCFNAEEVLKQTVDSLLKQTCIPDEILIIDDGSTDASASIGRAYGGIVKVVQQQNTGAAMARYRGVLESKFSIVVFIDAGDSAAPGKVESYRSALAAHPGCVCAFGIAWNRAQAQPVHSKFTSGPLDGGFSILEDPINFMLSHYWPVAGVMDIAVRREVALKSMNVSAFYRVANDYAAQIMTALHGPFVHVAQITSEFVFLPKGLTNSHGLPLQIAYALCGAVDACELWPEKVDNVVFEKRIDADIHRSLLIAYLRKDWPLAQRLLRIWVRYGSKRKFPRQIWWALKDAHQDRQLDTARVLKRLVSLLARFSQQQR